jgi:hypothetical protein
LKAKGKGKKDTSGFVIPAWHFYKKIEYYLGK